MRGEISFADLQSLLRIMLSVDPGRRSSVKLLLDHPWLNVNGRARDWIVPGAPFGTKPAQSLRLNSQPTLSSVAGSGTTLNFDADVTPGTSRGQSFGAHNSRAWALMTNMHTSAKNQRMLAHGCRRQWGDAFSTSVREALAHPGYRRHHRQIGRPGKHERRTLRPRP